MKPLLDARRQLVQRDVEPTPARRLAGRCTQIVLVDQVLDVSAEPLANLQLTEGDYAWVTRELVGVLGALDQAAVAVQQSATVISSRVKGAEWGREVRA